MRKARCWVSSSAAVWGTPSSGLMVTRVGVFQRSAGRWVGARDAPLLGDVTYHQRQR